MQPRRRRPPRRRCRRLWLVQPPTLTYSVLLWSRLRKETLTTRELASPARRRWYHPRRPTQWCPIGRLTHVISGKSATCWNFKEKDNCWRRIYSLNFPEEMISWPTRDEYVGYLVNWKIKLLILDQTEASLLPFQYALQNKDLWLKSDKKTFIYSYKICWTYTYS